jgi:hypothetical protein
MTPRAAELLASIVRLAQAAQAAAKLSDQLAFASDIELAATEVVEQLTDQQREEDGPGDNVLLRQLNDTPPRPFTMLDKDYPERYRP